jgi:hypothetical protein
LFGDVFNDGGSVEVLGLKKDYSFGWLLRAGWPKNAEFDD